jgi:hypothetical protein
MRAPQTFLTTVLVIGEVTSGQMTVMYHSRELYGMSNPDDAN